MSANRTSVAENTRSNNPVLVTDTSPLLQQVSMNRGEETKEETKDKAGNQPPPNDDLDTDNNSTMSSADTETDFLKYLAPEYRKFKASLDLSDVITLERKLGTALWNIPNKYKVGG